MEINGRFFGSSYQGYIGSVLHRCLRMLYTTLVYNYSYIVDWLSQTFPTRSGLLTSTAWRASSIDLCFPTSKPRDVHKHVKTWRNTQEAKSLEGYFLCPALLPWYRDICYLKFRFGLLLRLVLVIRWFKEFFVAFCSGLPLRCCRHTDIGCEQEPYAQQRASLSNSFWISPCRYCLHYLHSCNSLQYHLSVRYCSAFCKHVHWAVMPLWFWSKSTC